MFLRRWNTMPLDRHVAAWEYGPVNASRGSYVTPSLGDNVNATHHRCVMRKLVSGILRHRVVLPLYCAVMACVARPIDAFRESFVN